MVRVSLGFERLEPPNAPERTAERTEPELPTVDLPADRPSQIPYATFGGSATLRAVRWPVSAFRKIHLYGDCQKSTRGRFWRGKRRNDQVKSRLP